jgi:hypothetical protein
VDSWVYRFDGQGSLRSGKKRPALIRPRFGTIPDKFAGSAGNWSHPLTERWGAASGDGVPSPAANACFSARDDRLWNTIKIVTASRSNRLSIPYVRQSPALECRALHHCRSRSVGTFFNHSAEPCGRSCGPSSLLGGRGMRSRVFAVTLAARTPTWTHAPETRRPSLKRAEAIRGLVERGLKH